ncbi:hypothetical protein STAFG_0869 [Streptomyces afghaniensis 772]|uniref:Uncharacterized protein n=1 Tax=Streptomyces afghaniensis 772 TaxID=1283301 RepID=S4N3B2_9ACTN|nr:hypothetical protein STAFG_0869 [Streptomyces afghaniensis 772]
MWGRQTVDACPPHGRGIPHSVTSASHPVRQAPGG